jgi:LEA14-like dessication related protein
MREGQIKRWIIISTAFVLLLSITSCEGAIEDAVKTPQIDLYVNVDGLSSSGLNVDIQARITNPNPLSLDIGDLEVIARGETGHNYIQDIVSGGSIAPNSSRTFTHDIIVPLDVLNERTMVIALNTRAGAAGITLPVTATITIRTPNIRNFVSTPAIALSVNIGQLSSNGLDMSLQANINNPNPLSLDMDNMQIVIEGQSGNVIMTDTIQGGSIPPNSSGTFGSNIIVPLQVFNERNIIVTVNSRTGVAGITLPIRATVTIEVPKLSGLISVPKPDVYVSTPRLRLPPAPPGIEVPTRTTMTNDNNIGLILGDLHINLYESGGQSVKTVTAPGGTIPAYGTRTFEHSIILGLELLNIIGSSSVTVKVNTQVGISGINEMLPIEGQFTLELPPFPPWP